MKQALLPLPGRILVAGGFILLGLLVVGVISSGSRPSLAQTSATPTPWPGFEPAAAAQPVAMPAMARPPLGEAVTDPAFDTRLVRVTGQQDEDSFGTHIYSQLQAFSANNEFLLLIEDGRYTIRRLDDLSLLPLDTASWNAPRWWPGRDASVIHFDSNDDTTVRVLSTDVRSGAAETIFTFPPQYEYVQVTPSFDELSRDGRWLAGAVTRNEGAFVMFALDLENQALGAVMALDELYAGDCSPNPEWGNVPPDWVGVSPLGDYLVVQWARDGTQRCSGLETFDIQRGAFVGRVYDGHQHGDLGLLPDGGQFFMTFELASPLDNNRPAIALRRLPGTATVSPPEHLLVVDWADDGHISCQGPPGVCLVTYGGWPDDGWTPFEKELFLVSTTGQVRRLAHHRSSSCGYWVQPRASLSVDGRYAVFASDWLAGTGQAGCTVSDLGQGDVYVLEITP